MRALAPWSVLLASGLAVAFLGTPPQRRSDSGSDDPVLLPRQELLRVVGAGQLPLVTSYYWIQTIQAVSVAHTEQGYLNVYRLADLVTDLDPRFAYVYRFCGPSIPIHVGRWVWKNTHEAEALLRKGIAVSPQNWQLRADLGYILAFLRRDTLRGAAELKAASLLPGAPRRLSEVASRMLAYGGEFDAAIAYTEKLRDSAEDDETKAHYERRILEIEQEILLRKLDGAVARYTERVGHPPDFVWEVTDETLPYVPIDPLGSEFYLGDDQRPHAMSRDYRLEPLRLPMME